MKLTTAQEITNIVGGYENTRELTDLIQKMQKDAEVLKSCIANLIDHIHGSTGGSEQDGPYRGRLISEFAATFQISEEMSEIIVDATNETAEASAFNII